MLEMTKRSRFASPLIALVLVVVLTAVFSATASAEGNPEDGTDAAAVVCTCTEACSADTINSDCPVCASDPSACALAAVTDGANDDTTEESDGLNEIDVEDTLHVTLDNAGDQESSDDETPQSPIEITVTSCKWDHIYGLYSSNYIYYPRVRDARDISLEEVISDLNRDVNSIKVSYTYTYTPDATEGSTGSGEGEGGAVSQDPVTVTRTDVIISDTSNDIYWNTENMSFDAVSEYIEEHSDDKGFRFNDSKDITFNNEYLLSLIKEYELGQNGCGLKQDDVTVLSQNSKTVSIKCAFGPNTTVSALTEDILKNNMISTVSPSNVELNLFDYWILDEEYSDYPSDEITGDTPRGKQFVSSGVNKNHGLLFRKSIGLGLWNTWTGGTGGARQGIVKHRLANNGFPELNLNQNYFNNSYMDYTFDQEEDLGYLFDTSSILNTGDELKDTDENAYGRAYTDVTGLFKINEDGNYYYSSHENFAEFDKEKNSFNVYNTWGINNGGTSGTGQFLPFEEVDKVFSVANDGTLKQANINSVNPSINHYLGLSMAVDFQQPIDGLVSVGTNAKPMVFEFSGDDDVWIYIDNVLIADLGGIHDEVKVTIDFSTGAVHIERAKDPNEASTIDTTIRAMVEAANADTEITLSGNTLASGTRHTLRMFYLERGNTDSNLTLSFNLMEPVENEVIKLDQNGNAIDGAEFEIYVAALDENGEPVASTKESGKYMVDGDAITGTGGGTTITTDANGRAVLPDYDWSQHEYYILRETKAPDGYFSNGDIVLRYDHFQKHDDGTSSGTNLLLVDNRWTTAAVTNFTATITQAGSLKYQNETEPIDSEVAKAGLILAVPLMKDDAGNCYPLYGSNIDGFQYVDTPITGSSASPDARRAILTAALYQIVGAEYSEGEGNTNYGYQKWYLEWSDSNARFEGKLVDLPGDASRYVNVSGDTVNSDLTVAYYFLDMNALSRMFGPVGGTAASKYDAIWNYVKTQMSQDSYSSTEEAIENIVSDMVDVIAPSNQQDIGSFAMLNISDFNRTYSTRVYVANTRSELGVQKLDINGNPIEGVTFSLFASKEDAMDETEPPLAKGTTDGRGLLVFSGTGTENPGSAKMDFVGETTYYLKETAVPEDSGYTPSDNIVPVYVTWNGRLYANALEENDGITVRKGLGGLLSTMTRYATDGSVDVTLRDITAVGVTTGELKDMQGAIEGTGGEGTYATLGSVNLHYGLEGARMDYGAHETESGVTPNPYFETDTDWLGVIVKQNYDAHAGDALYETVAEKTDLRNEVIRGLFTGSTTVVVRNANDTDEGAFSITKTVSGEKADQNQSFEFEVIVQQQDGTPVSWGGPQGAKYVVSDDSGEQLESGTLTFSGDETSGWKISTVTAYNATSSAYITRKSVGSGYVIKLAHNQKIVVTGVPFDLKVTVSEILGQDSGYTTSYQINGGAWASGTEAAGIVMRAIGNPAFVFNNYKTNTADLTIKKTVHVENGLDSTQFPFEIIVSDANGVAPLTGKFKYQIQPANGQEVTGEFDFNDSTKRSVKLASGDVLTIADLPVGATYVVTETTLGYTPEVTINGNPVNVVNGSVSGTIGDPDPDGSGTPDEDINTVKYVNTRSGSITITKRTGTGGILSGAGFTLFKVDADSGVETKVGNESFTNLALRTEIASSDPNYDSAAGRYTTGGSSYVVHKSTDGTPFYYRFLTEAERSQYYDGTFLHKDNVESIVQFDDLSLTDGYTYTIEETTIPSGYGALTSSERLTGINLPMTPEGPTDSYYDLLYTVTNHAEMVLPSSGMSGIGSVLAVGAGLVVAAVVVLWSRSRDAAIPLAEYSGRVSGAVSEWTDVVGRHVSSLRGQMGRASRRKRGDVPRGRHFRGDR